MGITITET